MQTFFGNITDFEKVFVVNRLAFQKLWVLYFIKCILFYQWCFFMARKRGQQEFRVPAFIIAVKAHVTFGPLRGEGGGIQHFFLFL